ncbi:hypothetical protein Trydic_g16661 [Trypoxylus dichotomus]
MQKLNGCENVTTQDVARWAAAEDSEEEPSIEELTTAFQRTRNVDDDDEDDNMQACMVNKQRISHQEDFATLQKALLRIIAKSNPNRETSRQEKEDQI